MSTYQNIFCPYKSTKPEFYSRQNIKKLKGYDLYTHTRSQFTVVSKPCKTPPIKSFLRHQSSKSPCRTLAVPAYRCTFSPVGLGRAEVELRTTSLGGAPSSRIRLCLTWAGRGALLHTIHCCPPCSRGLLPSQATSSSQTRTCAQMCTHRKTELHLLVHTLVADEYETKSQISSEWQHMLIFVTLSVSKCHLPWTQSKVTEQLSTRFSCTSVKNWNYRAKQVHLLVQKFFG